MLGNFKPVAFDPYGRRRRRRVMPGWLALLLLGGALGVAGVLLVQERLLPPRLSSSESTRLQQSLQSTEAERTRLTQSLAETRQRLDAEIAAHKKLAEQTASHTQIVDGLRADLQSAIAALPPDPRGGDVEVRAARFGLGGDGALQYDVVLTRAKAGGGKPMPAVLQFVVEGAGARGNDTRVTLAPVSISVDRLETVRGSVPLPDGFKPRQTTVNVLDKPDGRRLGMRVFNLK
jgi:hypothetical protein